MTTTQQTKLPPLPDAHKMNIGIIEKFNFYSESQMFAYGQLCREQVLEDAAAYFEGHWLDEWNERQLVEKLRSMK